MHSRDGHGRGRGRREGGGRIVEGEGGGDGETGRRREVQEEGGREAECVEIKM